ncbi:MAG TPA: hypothetical protein VF269_08080 [Rhodanobacteraceae bacterium]
MIDVQRPEAWASGRCRVWRSVRLKVVHPGFQWVSTSAFTDAAMVPDEITGSSGMKGDRGDLPYRMRFAIAGRSSVQKLPGIGAIQLSYSG